MDLPMSKTPQMIVKPPMVPHTMRGREESAPSTSYITMQAMEMAFGIQEKERLSKLVAYNGRLLNLFLFAVSQRYISDYAGRNDRKLARRGPAFTGPRCVGGLQK